MELLHAPGCDYSHVHVVKALFHSGSKVMFIFSSQVKHFFTSPIGRPASDTKSLWAKIPFNITPPLPLRITFRILPLLHPNRL